MPSWTRWKTSRSAAGERPRYSTTVGGGEEEAGGGSGGVNVYGLLCVARHVLHVMDFWAKICFSYVGISVRDALVVEVVYHHCFFVFGQRSGIMDA
jgi:hypothetical protein